MYKYWIQATWKIKGKKYHRYRENIRKKIDAAFKNFFSKHFKRKISKSSNPYGDGRSSEKIVNILLNAEINDKMIFKKLTY